MTAAATGWALLGGRFSHHHIHTLDPSYYRLGYKKKKSHSVRLLHGWMSSGDCWESVQDGTGRDRTGTAWAAHLQDSWREAPESEGMCASEACISKSDLSCGCLWWCPHGRALRYGTWPLSGPSVWPFLFAGSLRRWPAAPASSPPAPNPRPGSPPGTTRPLCPSPTGPGASEIHSWREEDKKTKKNKPRLRLAV